MIPEKRAPYAFRVSTLAQWEREVRAFEFTNWLSATIRLNGVPIVTIDLKALRAARKAG